MTSLKSIKVTPSVGEFSDVEPGMIFVIPFTIHNVSDSVKRVRFAPPKTSFFRLINTQQSIAPGMKQTVEVEFTSKEVKEIHDFLTIKTEEGELQIPLHAWFPAPNVMCDPAIELGKVSMQHPIESKRFRLRNSGKRDGVFKFVEDSAIQGLSLVPQSGVVPAGKSLDVLLHFFPVETGAFRGSLSLQIDQQPTRLIEVSADVVESRVGVVDKDHQAISRVSFGKLYFGQKVSKTVYVQNFSEHTVSFTVRPVDESGATENDDNSTQNSLPIECSPKEGRIGGNGVCPVTITFTPRINETRRGWEHSHAPVEELARNWDVPFVIEAVETEQRIDLQVSGKATPTLITLSESHFRFPDCSVNDHSDFLFSFVNDNPDLPCQFSLSRVAQFRCEPFSGTVEPLGRQNILLTFQPNQLGSFRGTMQLTLNGGVKKVPIVLSGSAGKIGPRKPAVGGPDKVREDFVRPLQFTRTATSAPSNYAPTIVSTPRGDEADAADDVQPDLLLMSEWQQKREHNRLYNNFVTNSRKIREYNDKVAKGAAMDLNPDDIGMVPAEGLDEPEPVMTKREDRLAWTQQADASSKGEGPALRKALRVDENKLIKKKFRREPSNLNEMRECKLELSPTDIQSIITPIKVLDFQQVSVYSTNTKSFFVYNGLKTHIAVTIPFQRDELALSTPPSQVIPPGQIAGFDIVFRSETVQTFQQAIYFTINETHKLKFVVFAEVIPIDVGVSHKELQFRFPDFGSEPSVTLPLTLMNSGNSNAEFQWGFSGEDPGAFSFQPPTGFVPASGTLSVNVTYTPVLSSNETIAEAMLRVKGSTGAKKIVLNGGVPNASCSWSVKDGRVDFKKLPVGSIRSQMISVKNNGSTSTVFAFDPNGLAPGVSIAPLRGRIAAGAVEDIQIQLKATTAQPVKCNLSCHVRGMKQLLKAQVFAEAKVPDVTIVDPPQAEDGDSQLDFGGVYVGSFELRRVQVQNNDDVPAFFKLDLSSFSMFSVYDSERRAVDNIAGDKDDLAANAVGNVAFYRQRAFEDEDPADIRKSNIYRVAVNAHQSFHFFLAFTPTYVGALEAFILPLTLAGLDPSAESSHPIVVSGEGKKPRLVMTPSIIDFGPRVVSRENTSKIPNRILLRLTNETDADLPWELQGKNFDTGVEVFRVEPTSGRLPPGQSSQVQFTFTPSEVKAFTGRYSIYLDGNKESKYMDVVAKGFGANPFLTFDRKELILPPVPLDVVTKATFYISNDGYESLDLRYKIAGDGKLPVSLAFPDGQTITSNHNVLPVEVSFIAKKPMTFTVNIDFYDDMDGIFSIPVTCTADNSLMTTFGYIKYREGAYNIASDSEKKPLMYTESEDAMEKDTTPRHSRDGSSAAGQDDSSGSSYQTLDQVLKKTLTKRSIERLRNWLNCNLLHDPIDDLVPSLQANQGKMVNELIELLFGKGPSAAAKAETVKVGHDAKTNPPRKDTSGSSVLEPFDALLLFLKQYGACVSEIRAEFLLRYDEYAKLPIDAKGPKQAPKLPERKFAARSLHAWSTVVYQLVKVFYFSRITWKSLKSMPQSAPIQAVSSAEKWSSLNADPTCTGSNVYSTPESLVLRWLSIHFGSVFGTKSADKKRGNDAGGRICNFEGDVRDCKAYAACVQSYIPSLASKFDVNKENGFVLNPSSSSDLERNATLLLDAMREYGMDTRVTGREFLDFGGRDHLLFSAYLFNTLPQYIPKTTIKFKGKLLEKISKQIEISNPTRWPVDYLVSLDGNDEFKIAEQKFHLEPKSSGNFTIQVTPRFSKKIDGRCMFLSSRGGTFSAATMIFNLETEVDGDSAVRTFDNLETPMYEVVQNEVQIENPFPMNGQFSIQVHQEYVKDPSGKTYPEEASLTLFPDAFWSPIDSLSIKKNEKAKFVLQFLPCVRGQYRAHVTFKDDKVGEFAYNFVGTCTPPKALDTISLQAEAAVSVTREVSIPFRNIALEKAMQQKEERFKIFKGSRKVAQQKETEPEGKEVSYKLDFVNDKFVGPNPFYNGPKTFLMKPEQRDDDDASKRKTRNDKLQGQSFNISFLPKGPGSYNGFLLLSSTWDVRLVAIEGKSRSPGMKAELEFNCPARQQITQEIPITNTSEKEWIVSAQLSGEYFSGPRELRVPSGRTKSYALNFNPQWMCDATGQLVLRNNDTQEKYTYTLKGKAEEPLAENTIPVECKARETRKITINVPNITFDEVTYTVETDLPFVAGDSRVTVPKMEVGKYVLNINPQISGKTTGSITFVAPNKQYVWFVLQLAVLRPPPEDTITIDAEVRKGSAAEITITNPTNKLVDFTVRKKGEGLFGDDILTIEPSKSAVYQLAFAPVKSGTVDGVISFNNDDIGEFWYRLSLVGKDAAPQQLNFQCEIGKSTTQEVFLQNPLDTECTMLVSSTNEVNYTVVPQQVILKPNTSTRVAITYIPSAIQSGQEALVRLFHSSAGLWEFKCRGTGLPPTKMDSVTCVAQVGRMSSVNVMFRNPFPTPKKFTVALHSTDSVFSLMQKKSALTLGPFQTSQISVAYQPLTIAAHTASVVTQLVQDQQLDAADLVWEFPISGIAEFLSLDVPAKLMCKSRKRTTASHSFLLEGYHGTSNNEDFDAELVVGKDTSLSKAIVNSLVFRRQEDAPSASSVGYDFDFSPLRPFTSTVEFLIKKKGGGAWRFPLSLEATSPDPDDVILMEAAVNATTTVSFQLYNVLPQSSTFTAYFTAESPQEFSVNPAKGTLPPMPTSQTARGSGTAFSVGFSSTQYGKTLIGYLMIDTDEMQWRYEVRGTLPKYQPPSNVTSKVQNRLRPETENAMKRIQNSLKK